MAIILRRRLKSTLFTTLALFLVIISLQIDAKEVTVFKRGNIALVDETQFENSVDFEQDEDDNAPADTDNLYDEKLANLPRYVLHKKGEDVGLVRVPIVTRKGGNTWSTPRPKTVKGDYKTWNTDPVAPVTKPPKVPKKEEGLFALPPLKVGLTENKASETSVSAEKSSEKGKSAEKSTNKSIESSVEKLKANMNRKSAEKPKSTEVTSSIEATTTSFSKTSPHVTPTTTKEATKTTATATTTAAKSDAPTTTTQTATSEPTTKVSPTTTLKTTRVTSTTTTEAQTTKPTSIVTQPQFKTTQKAVPTTTTTLPTTTIRVTRLQFTTTTTVPTTTTTTTTQKPTTTTQTPSIFIPAATRRTFVVPEVTTTTQQTTTTRPALPRWTPFRNFNRVPISTNTQNSVPSTTPTPRTLPSWARSQTFSPALLHGENLPSRPIATQVQINQQGLVQPLRPNTGNSLAFSVVRLPKKKVSNNRSNSLWQITNKLNEAGNEALEVNLGTNEKHLVNYRFANYSQRFGKQRIVPPSATLPPTVHIVTHLTRGHGATMEQQVKSNQLFIQGQNTVRPHNIFVSQVTSNPRPFVNQQVVTTTTTTRPVTQFVNRFASSWSSWSGSGSTDSRVRTSFTRARSSLPPPSTTTPAPIQTTTTIAFSASARASVASSPIPKPPVIHHGENRYRGPTYNCRVLMAGEDGRPSPRNDFSCRLKYPGFPADNQCRCTYEVAGRDAHGCATGFLYTCHRI